MSERISRRRFITAASTTAAALSAAGPRLARAAAGANERVRLGMIGVGDRGTAHIREISKLAKEHNVEIAAICDVWRLNREAAAARLSAAGGRTPKTCSRYGELLAMKDIDAVVIATPDFAHAPIAIEALKAGKDVYVEKPMSLSVAEANQALDLAREKQRIVQVGTQHRSEGLYLAAQREYATGVLGTVSRFSVTVGFNLPRWMRPSVDDCKEADVDWEAFLLDGPKRPFDARLLRCWQLYKLCTNGLAGLWMSHYADLVHLITGAKYPSSGVAHGGIYVWKDGREHPDTFHAVLEYPEGFLFDWSMSLGTNTGITVQIHGTKGTMDVEKRRLHLVGQATGKAAASQPYRPESNESHMGNWLACIRSRKLPNADIQYGHQHAVATIMAAEALTSRRRQAYDMEKRELK